MRFLGGLFVVCFLMACFKKAPKVDLSENKMDEIATTATQASAALREKSSVTKSEKEKNQLLNKEQREAIYFSASLEREALRVLTKDQVNDGMSLFSVLSYAVEVNAGVKKNAPPRLDCTRFKFAQDPKNKKAKK